MTVHESGTFAEALVATLHRRPDLIAFEDGDRTYTYAATADLIARMIAVFERERPLIGRGMGVLSLNRSEAWMAAVSVQIAGGFYVALPTRSSVEDLTIIANDASLEVLVADAEFEELAGKLVAQVPSLQDVYVLGKSELGPDLFALAEAAGSHRLVSAPGLDWRADAHIMYSGGTTGRPKGAVHLQRGGLEMNLRPLWAWDLPRGARSLAIAPMTHSGYGTIAPTLFTGGTIVVARSFAPDMFAHMVHAHQITATVGVPTMIYQVIDYARENACDLSSLRQWIYSASPISPKRLAEAHEMWGKIFVQVYSTSETYGVGTVLLTDEHDSSRPDRLASCGRAIPGAQIRIVDGEDIPVPTGTVGEIVMRGVGIMDRYLNLPQLTAEVMRNGWFHTGDLAFIDDDGYISIVDRKKDMIISGGYNVYSREVEDALLSHPDVDLAVVIGIPDDRWGEAVKALVVPVPGSAVTEEELKQHVYARKGAVQTPKSIDLVPAVPLTPLGKVDKKAVRSRYWAQGERRVH